MKDETYRNESLQDEPEDILNSTIEIDEDLFDNDDIDFEAEADGENNYGKIYSQDAWKDLIANFKSSDPLIHDQAGELIYKALLPFIKHVASKYYGTYFIKYGEDLIAAGQVGLIESLGTYNPERGKPTTWCFRQIIHQMRDFVDREVHHTTPHYQSHLREILKYVNDCKMKGLPCTIEDINIATGFPKPTIQNCMTLYERNQNQVSMEQYIGDNKATVADMMTSYDPSPEDTIINKESTEALFQIMKEELLPIELEVLGYHHGVFGDDPKSAAEISEILGLKKQDIRPMINMAEQKLRRAMTYDPRFNEERRERTARQVTSNFFKQQENLLRELDSFEFDDETDL